MQVWEVNAGSNFLGQDEMTAHFGLDSGAGTIDSVVVTMLSGAVFQFPNVVRNSTLAVTD